MRTLVNKVQDHIQRFNPYMQVRSELAYNVFYKTFDVVEANTPELLERVHRLRYQVFCVENQGYEDPSAHPDQQERDVYDPNSKHALLIYKPTNTALGTARIVLPNLNDLNKSFPLQNICSEMTLHNAHYIKNSCEISRLCVSNERRAQIKEDIANTKQIFLLQDPTKTRIALTLAPIGLIGKCFEMAIKSNIMHCYGIMEPHHLQRLVTVGLKHRVLGENIDYHGERTPFMMNILETFDHTIAYRRDVWSIASNRGVTHKFATALHKYQLAEAEARLKAN